MSAAATTNLSRVRPGFPATITQVAGDDPLAHRLMAMGFRPGTPVRTLRSGPFGGGMQVHLRGVRFALRADEAARVGVLPGGGQL